MNDITTQLAEALKIIKDSLPHIGGSERSVHSLLQVAEAALTAYRSKPATPAAEPTKLIKRLIGWRTDDYLMETSDKAKAENWAVHHTMLPIFEGDPHTKLSAPQTQPQAGELPQAGDELLSKVHAQIRYLIDELTTAVDDDGLTRYVPPAANSLLYSNFIGAMIPLAEQLRAALAQAARVPLIEAARDVLNSSSEMRYGNFSVPEHEMARLESALGELRSAPQEPTGSEVRHQVFALCEATEDDELSENSKDSQAAQDFLRGRKFEAKQIRRAIGTWFVDNCTTSSASSPAQKQEGGEA